MKTYELTSIGVYRYANGAYAADWSASASGGYGQVGKVSGYYAFLGYCFDPAALAALRQKPVRSVLLRLKTQSYPRYANMIDISYAQSNDTAACRRSDADGAASYAPIGDLFTLPHVTADGFTDLDLGDFALPQYGYLIGPHGSTTQTNAYVLFDNSTNAGSGYVPAVLTVTTDEATLTYDANGGTNAPEPAFFPAGEPFTLSSSAPVREGYAFAGWSSTADGAAAYAAGGTYTFDSDTTLYAVWQKRTYTIAFDANGGSGAPASQTKTHGVDLTLPVSEPGRSGFVFAGWALEADGDAAFAPGKPFSIDADTTLFAVWTDARQSYTVSYDPNGGSDAPAPQTKTHGASLTLSSTAPTRLGHTFSGWALFASASDALYQPGGTYTVNADAVLYAVWQPITYTVAYSANGGSNAPAAQTKQYGVDCTLSEAVPTRGGYTFLGWGQGGAVAYLPGAVYAQNASVTLSALWSAVAVCRTLTYDANGGANAPAAQAVLWDDATRQVFSITGEAPTRAEHDFCGWSLLPDGDAAYFGGDTIAAQFDKVLYAVWRRRRSRRDHAVCFCGADSARTEPLYRYDYGQGLTFPDLDLPAVYEVHFAIGEHGESVTALGDETGVSIPDALLAVGEPISAWIFLHDGGDDGETVRRVTIPVLRRARPGMGSVSPEEQNLLSRAVALLHDALVETKEAADALRQLHAGDVSFAKTADYAAGTVGNALQQKADAVGTYADLTAGFAQNLLTETGTTEQTPYQKRASGGSAAAGEYEIDKLVGGTVVWNQLAGSGASVTIPAGRRYVACIGGTWRTGVSDGTALAVSDGDQVFDLSLMFGIPVSDQLGAMSASDVIAWFRSLFPKTGYAFHAGELMSVQTSAHIMRDADDAVIGRYPLDPSLILRGAPKLTASNQLYYSGDTYASDGTVTRRYDTIDLGTLAWTYNATYAFFAAQVSGIRRLPWWEVADANPLVCSAYPFAGYNGSNAEMANVPDKSIVQRLNNEAYIRVKDSAYTNAAAFREAMSGKMLVFERETPITEYAEPFRNPQRVDANGTEEYVDERDVPIPVGHETVYANNLLTKLETAPDAPGSDGDYFLRRTNGVCAYVKLPALPSAAGTYALKVTVTTSGKTLSWV